MATEDRSSASTSNVPASTEKVPMSDKATIRNLCSTLDAAKRTYTKAHLENAILIKENNELKSVHIIQDSEKAVDKRMIINLSKHVADDEILISELRKEVAELTVKANAYFLSVKASKAFFDMNAVNHTTGVGYDYNKAIGETGINSPMHVIAPNVPVPHILKDTLEPFYKKSIAEPPNVKSIIIQEEMRVEDLASGNVQGIVLPVKGLPKRYSKTDRKASKGQTKFVPAKMTSDNNCDSPVPVIVNNTTNASHAMPAIDKSHKACDLPRCMTCAFNVMSDYFLSNQASDNKSAPRHHINNKFVKPVKARTASPPRSRKDTQVYTRPKTASPVMTGKKAYVPKLKQPVVKAVYKVKHPDVKPVYKQNQHVTKAVYRVKCPVLANDDLANVKNVILPDKGQFFKYAGPNQMWVRKKV
jgi:hypothetical protein